VDSQGNVDLDYVDGELDRRLQDCLPKNYELPTVIPLLLWRNCFYLGSTAPDSPEVQTLIQKASTEIQLIPISSKSYQDWDLRRKLDPDRLDPDKYLKIFQDCLENEQDIRTITANSLLNNTDPTEQLNIIITGALYHRVSDIHLEPNPAGLRIRYRIDGILRDIVKPGSGVHRKLISALKVISDMDISENRRPQDGKTSMEYRLGTDKVKKVDMRISTFRGVHGEKAVIRILERENQFSKIDELGFTKPTLDIYKKWLHQPQGMIIITGPTGSGKTSTLYASLQQVITEAKNVVTIEDPVEYVLPGITQGQVNEKAGVTFAAGLRAILRQDPDIVMVGEIRDEETAETAIRAALTGHLVFTTLHTNDAISVIPRLKGLSSDPSLLSDALLGIVAQRLVRKLCPHCAQPYQPTDEDFQYLNLDPTYRFAQEWKQEKGCAKCSDLGFKGREALVELINVDSTVRQLIRDDKITDLKGHLKNHSSFSSFQAAAICKVFTGATSIAEIKRILSFSLMEN
jgi:type II secretory ATPase GspE/PulE/Tfp pilus assembly ATPase PilB-like protein